MGDYSNELPSRDLLFHYTFDTVRGDRIIDESPHGRDATLKDDAEIGVGHPGRGLNFSGDLYEWAEVPGDVQIVDGKSIVAVMRNDGTSSGNTLTAASTVAFGSPGDVDELLSLIIQNPSNLRVVWDFGPFTTDAVFNNVEQNETHVVVVTIDESGLATVYLDGREADSYAERDTHDNLGSSYYKFDAIGSGVSGVDDPNVFSQEGMIDEVRVYDAVLTKEDAQQLTDLHKHKQIDNIGDVWPTEGMPYIRGAGNAEFAGVLGTHADRAFRTLDKVLDARHIDEAGGKQLDRIGNLVGLRRETDEGDGRYRARIKGTVIAGRSRGNFTDILNGVAAILDADTDDVRLERGWEFDGDTKCATVYIYVLSSDLAASPLSGSDLTELAEDMVFAGHRVEVFETTDDAFELTADGETSDPDKGLTGSGTSRGGTLVGDA